ncbi:MAG: Kdo domain containing protein, partial [Flavobacteriaceae bacterium]|nr:Kdo domain containing protein [Flavobacteriaceae bacterium]
YYVCEFVNADFTYRELINDPSIEDRDAILRDFTRFTFQLHENGILFKDHSPGNTLIKRTEQGTDFYLVDLNRMEFKTLSFEERILNFTKLTPKKEMVEIMSDEYAQLIGEPYEKVVALMWGETSAFQERYWRKVRMKEKLFFWRNKK